MSDNTREFCIGGYSNETDVVSGSISLATKILQYLRNFAVRMRDEQVEASHQSNRKREMLARVQRESIKRMPLENLIRMGFYHF